MPSCWRHAYSLTSGDAADAAPPGPADGVSEEEFSDGEVSDCSQDDIFGPLTGDEDETPFPTSARIAVEGRDFVCYRDTGTAICASSPELAFAPVPGGGGERVLALPLERDRRRLRVLREADVVYRAFHGPESVPRGWRVAGSGPLERLRCYRAVAPKDYRWSLSS